MAKRESWAELAGGREARMPGQRRAGKLVHYIQNTQKLKSRGPALSQPPCAPLPPPPPPTPTPTRHTSSNISRTPGATDFILSDNLNKLICKTKTCCSTTSTNQWLPQQRPKLMHVFEKHTSAVSMQKLTRTQRFRAVSMKSVSNVVCCRNLGLIVRLMASWWQFSFLHLFRASTTLNRAILFSWQQEWCHSIWLFISFLEKSYFCWLSTWATRFLVFE